MDREALLLCAREALTNAADHGNQFNPALKVEVELVIEDGLVVLTVRDQGRGFDPQTVPDPRAAAQIERAHGRGLMLMRAFAAVVEHATPGNEIRIRFQPPRSTTFPS